MTVTINKSYKVTEGRITIPTDYRYCNTLKEVIREMEHVGKLVSLLTPEDLANAEQDCGEPIDVETDNIEALRFAVEHCYVCDHCLAVEAVLSSIEEDLSDDEIDAVIDEVDQYEWTSAVLSDGTILVSREA